MAKNKDYWKERFEEIEDSQYNKSVDCYNNLQKQYRMTINDIEMEISKWYIRLEDNNEISLQAAKKLLKADELKEFHWSVEEYIKYGNENALDQRWMKELENASAKVHISKLEAMKLQMQQHIEKLFTEYEGGTTEFLNKSFRNQYYNTAYEIAKGTGIGTNLHEINSKTIDSVLNRPWASDGSNFSDRIWNNKRKLVNTLNTELTQGIIRGTPAQKMIENISKQMNVSKNQAGALVMTESAAISSKAQQQCFLDLDVEKYEIVATLDTHTSSICREMDGKGRSEDEPFFYMYEYQIGLTAPPFHVNCRTVTVPYFEDLGGERVARDENGNEVFVDSNMKYDEWFHKYVDKTSPNGIIKTDKQLGKKIGKHTKEYGLNPGNEVDRYKLIQIIDDIVTNADENAKGSWRGQEGIVDFYIKGSDVVVVNDGMFVTILKGGIENARVKDARKRKI